MIKLTNIQKLNNNLVKVNVVIESERNTSFEIVFDGIGNIVSTTANDTQIYYNAQARIAFRKYIGKEIPNEIYSMWY